MPNRWLVGPRWLTHLLTVVTTDPFGRFVLTCAERASVQSRRELMQLAGALSGRLGGTSATVSVRFGTASSDVRKCAVEPLRAETMTAAE